MKDIYTNCKKDKMFFITIIFLLLILIISFMNVYSVLSFTGEVETSNISTINTVIYYSDLDKFDDAYLLLNNKKYRLKNVNVTETIFQNDNYYYKVSFSIDTSINDNIIEGKILYDKQRLIFKLIN